MIKPIKYRKKPVVIEALVWLGQKVEMDKFLGSTRHHYTQKGLPNSLFIETLEGVHEARIGDYIIKGIKGEFYPCKPDIFKESYELTTQEPTK